MDPNGFWYRDPANGRAARQAFIVTRVGDTAMLLGLFLLFNSLGTLEIQHLMQRASSLGERGPNKELIDAIVEMKRPEVVIQRIADYRSDDKADPNYYARHTVMKAQAELLGRSAIERPTEGDRTEAKGIGFDH